MSTEKLPLFATIDTISYRAFSTLFRELIDKGFDQIGPEEENQLGYFTYMNPQGDQVYLAFDSPNIYISAVQAVGPILRDQEI